MHETALAAVCAFARTYLKPGDTVLDIGGADVNGSPRAFYVAAGVKYICVDMCATEGVDVVVPPGDPMPFETGSVDAVISTSCFEHDPCFWMTFREMCRVVKPAGFVYVNAPGNGPYHGHPGDNWRFYGDAGQALAVWSGHALGAEHPVFPVQVAETFSITPTWREPWQDFVCVWQRTDAAPTCITAAVDAPVGVLQAAVRDAGFTTTARYRGSR